MTDLTGLDISRLRMLCEIAGQGTFAAAASKMGFTPAAVSQQMATLERAVGLALFERTTRGVTLTEAGETLQGHAEAVLARLGEARLELDGLGVGTSGQVRFGSFTSATSTFTAHAVEVFRERHPGVEVTFVDGEPYESAKRLKGGQLDLAVVFEFDTWTSGIDYEGVDICAQDKIECDDLFDDPYVLILPRDHRLAAVPELQLEDLGDEPILAGSPWRQELATLAEGAGVNLNIDLSCRGTGFEVFQTFVSMKRGLTLMPRLALSWLRSDLVARPLHPAPVRRVRAATRVGATRSAAAGALLAVLQEVVQNDLSRAAATTMGPWPRAA